jgi:hypothetical protein
MAITSSTDIANLALDLIGAKQITSITADSVKEDQVCNRWYDRCRDRLLRKFPWTFAREVRPLVLSAGFYEYYDKFGGTAPAITGITKANPAVVSATSHGLATGDYCELREVGGMTELLETAFQATYVDANSFSLTGINSTNLTTYTSGGSVYRVHPNFAWREGYAYDLPSDYLGVVTLLDRESDFEVFGGRIYTTVEDATLVYTKQVTDVTSFDELFVDLLAADLARKICTPIVGAKAGDALLDRLERGYIIRRDEAYLVHQLELRIDDEEDDPWVTARSS